MATAVIMPRQGQSVESCLLSEWKKAEGDEVHTGDILFTYETDKAMFEEAAKVDGILLAVFCQEGDDIPCLDTVAVIGAPGEDFSSMVPSGAETAAPAEETKAAPAAETPANLSVTTLTVGAAVSVSPRARNTAERLHVALTDVAPTGPHGRVLERDVLAGRKLTAAAALEGGNLSGIAGTGIGGRIRAADLSAPASAPEAAAAAPAGGTGYHDEKLSHLRKVIGASMHKSLAEMAQLTHHSSFDATTMIAYRGQLKKAAETLELPNITYNDIVLFAVSRVLPHHPALNAHLLDDKMRFFDHVHLGMAVDTPRGLLVPTIFNADTKSLSQIAAEAKSLAAAAQTGSISPDLLTGASFTVSNLGSLGVEAFTPVINPPQTGILGVDCMIDRVRKVDGQITVYPAMGISLTYDHRALDGAPASRFLKELREALENITALLSN
jgi:Pyruvate/2-oxoglutarate dehydrogenase complex, dihydrolipoamide acyltransferase (E2) component, and related enzymes